MKDTNLATNRQQHVRFLDLSVLFLRISTSGERAHKRRRTRWTTRRTGEGRGGSSCCSSSSPPASDCYPASSPERRCDSESAPSATIHAVLHSRFELRDARLRHIAPLLQFADHVVNAVIDGYVSQPAIVLTRHRVLQLALQLLQLLSLLVVHFLHQCK